MAMEEEHKEPSSSDELLSPLAKLKKYADSDNIFERQAIVRNVLDTLRSVVESSEEVETVIGILWKLSDDIEPSVRAELMDQIPHIAVLCHEYRGRLFHITFQFLLRVVVNYLQDRNNQVRKTTQTALLILIERDLVDKGVVEDQVCPIILRLSDQENFEDFRTEAVALMSKMAPMVGREITERLFLKTFANLCVDGLFHVRKMCAANFGIICSVLAGTEAAEKILLSRFSYLCEDGIWNVRQACAEVFTTVSYTCSLEIRYNQLASLFVNLLRDQSRWVRAAAFQALGPFISTFADPSRTGLYFSDDGSHIIRDNRFFEEESASNEETAPSSNYRHEEENALINDNNNTLSNYQSTNCDNQNTSMLIADAESTKDGSVDLKSSTVDRNQCFETGESNLVESGDSGKSDTKSFNVPHLDYSSGEVVTDDSSQPAQSQLSVSGDSPGHIHVHLDENAFNSFHYWRIPIPELELDIDIVEGKPISINVKATVHDEQKSRLYSSQLNVNLGPSNEFSTKVENAQFKTDSIPVPESLKISSDGVTMMHEKVLHIYDTASEIKSVNEPVSFTRIRTASVGMIQDDSQEGATSNTVLLSNANEALVTSINGMVTDVKQSFVSQCTSPKVINDDDDNITQGMDPIFLHNVLSYIGGNNSTDCHLQVTNEVKNHIDRQNIVPGELLEHYVTMSDPSQMQLVDNEIPRLCAYSLPAVAMTLGRKNWPILKRLYEILASDMQWKVRRTLAFSIHELAMILGEELAYKDLFPIFNGFIKDLDEVRIGVLQHIADFIKLLGQKQRRDCLPKLNEFLSTDNECNWRFRLELAEQVGQLAALYQPSDIREFLMPVAMLLIADKVSEVRQTAIRVMSLLIYEVNSAPHEQNLVKNILGELAEQFAHHKKWTNRQTYAFLCHHLIRENSLPIEQYVSDVLPHLLDLSYDPVPNVRLSVAKTMSRIMIPLEFYSSHNPHHDLYIEVLQRLQVDPDRDVRFYANLTSQNNLSGGLTNRQLVLPV